MTKGNATAKTWQSLSVSTSARYVRFLFANPNKDARLGYLAEVEFRPATVQAAGEDGAIAETGDASASDDAPYPITRSGKSKNAGAAAVVHDGDPATAWTTTTEAPPARAHLWVDLGEVRRIGTVRWLAGEAGLAGRMRVQVSENGEAWATLGEADATSAGTWGELTVAVTGRFVRFAFANWDGLPALGGLAEVVVWPAAGPVARPTVDPPGAAAEFAPPTAVPVRSADAGPYPIVRGRRSKGSAPVRLLHDSDLATSWSTTTEAPVPEAWVELDLGAVYPVGTIRWLFVREGLADGMRIERSEDRREWRLLAEPGNAEPGQWQNLPTDVTARYIRFFFPNPNGDGQLGGLAEVEIWPPGVPPPPVLQPTPRPTVEPTAPTPTTEVMPAEAPTEEPVEEPTAATVPTDAPPTPTPAP